MWRWATTCAIKPGIHCRWRQYVPWMLTYIVASNNICPATKYAATWPLSTHGCCRWETFWLRLPLVASLFRRCDVLWLWIACSPCVVSRILCVPWLQASGGWTWWEQWFWSSCPSALSWACDEALLRSVSEVQKARVVIGQGAEIAQWLAGAPDSWSWSWVRIPARAAGEFSSPGSTFCADSYFRIRVTAVARKRYRPFCQKCRWQVTAKHAYTLRMWLCMKWHGARLCGVYRTCAETAAVSCDTSHASA